MEKDWYMSKAVWAGLIIIGYGVVNQFYDLSAFKEVIISIAGGLGVVGIRNALK